jgi:hypothetical protein
MDKVALGQAFFFLRMPQFVRVIIFAPMFHTHLHLHVARTGRKNETIVGNYQKATLLRELGERSIEDFLRFGVSKSLAAVITTCYLLSGCRNFFLSTVSPAFAEQLSVVYEGL